MSAKIGCTPALTRMPSRTVMVADNVTVAICTLIALCLSRSRDDW